MKIYFVLLSLHTLGTHSFELEARPNDIKNTLLFRDSGMFEAISHYEEFLKYYNVSECGNKTSDAVYVKRHILHGLLVDHNVPDTHWHEFKSVFRKRYRTASHEASALGKWRDNLRHVAQHNRQYLAGEQNYALHLNSLGDFGPNDYLRNILKLIDTTPLHDPAEDRRRTTLRRTLHIKLPRQVDWRSKGFRPRREQQWRCGACYAFAVTHAMQAQLYKTHREWTELSAQQIVDCSGTDGNFGCNGGSFRAALRYAAREGLHLERDYPYLGKKSWCRSNRLAPRVRARRWATLRAGDERAMERALTTIGPLAVAVNASPRTFQLYRTGIYDDPFCIPWIMNHAMLLVGYTPQYWILLNWWGPQWGEDGYMRLRRGLNQCGVANMATYVEL